MEKKTLITAVFISALLFSAVAGTLFVRLGKANPYQWKSFPPPVGMEAPSITVYFPKNDTVSGLTKSC